LIRVVRAVQLFFALQFIKSCCFGASLSKHALINVCRPGSCHHSFLFALQEATAAIKPILGQYYSKDNRNIITALWQEIAVCHFVSKEPATKSGIVWFQTATKEHLVRATDAAAAGFDADAAAKGVKAE
jgi:hypothetical protein